MAVRSRRTAPRPEKVARHVHYAACRVCLYERCVLPRETEQSWVTTLCDRCSGASRRPDEGAREPAP